MRGFKFAVAAVSLAILSACGGGDDSPLQVATETPPVNVTGAVVESLAGANTFSTGVTEFGTAGTPTTVTIGTGTAPTFSIAAGGSTAGGTMSFGSCIFTITSSTFPAGHPLSATTPPAAPRAVTVSTCQVDPKTQGLAAGGATANAEVAFVLGAARSVPRLLPVSISPTGVVTVNGRVVATIPLAAATGATGGA